MAASFDLGGVIYFARNIEEPRQVAELSREIASLASDLPFWISVDQEGGRVARLKRPFTEWPPMITLGKSGDEQLAARFARALADELRAVGINLDYAPVLDVRTNPANAVIGDRALAERAEDVARLGRVLVRTLQAAGVTACGKHFPGHGDTVADSHDELPIADYGRDRLDAVELVPFVGAIAEGVATLMTAHVLVPALDSRQPASLSSAIVTGLLKRELAFPGVVISDDLGMKAVSATRALPEASVAALAAGCDALLFCNSSPDEQVAALEAIIQAAESGLLSETRLDDAFARQRVAKQLLVQPPRARTIRDVIGSAEHQAIALEMAAFQ
jgi:beta-N-acetylhexosaminidase